MREDLRELIADEINDDGYECPICLDYVYEGEKCSCGSWSAEEFEEFIKTDESSSTDNIDFIKPPQAIPLEETIGITMRTCINFGPNCVGCHLGCIDGRRCRGYCSGCINEDCDNHPHRAKEES